MKRISIEFNPFFAGIFLAFLSVLVAVGSTYFVAQGQNGGLSDRYLTASEIGEIYQTKSEAAQASFPEGSLLLLDTLDCPAGWESVEDYEGRFILASSSERPVRTKGGSSSVQLTVEHLPRHAHGINDRGHVHTVPGIGFGDKRYSGGGGAAFGAGPDRAGTTSAAAGISVQETGNSQPVPIDPPFVSLKLCRSGA